MAALVNPSSSSSNSSNGRGLYDTSQTPPPLHSSHTPSRHRGVSGHDNETGSEASSPPPPMTSSQRDFEAGLSDSPGAGPTGGGTYMTTAAAAAAAAAAASSAVSSSPSALTDETAQFEADKRAIYK